MKHFDRHKLIAILILTALTVAGAAYLDSQKQQVWVPDEDLAIYQNIDQDRLKPKTVDPSKVPDDVVTDKNQLIDHYTLQPLSGGDFIPKSALVSLPDIRLISNTIPVALPATAAMAYNGKLAAGSVVTVWTVAVTGQAEPLLDEVLVLDVQRVEGQSEAERNANPYVVVLAVPRPKQTALLTAVAAGSITLTLVT